MISWGSAKPCKESEKENIMKQEELFDILKKQFGKILEEHGVSSDDITIKAKSLSPEEAIGKTEKKDYPILTGKEVMLEAEYKGSKGQAFTDAPSDFNGSLSDILALDTVADRHSAGLFIAALNAVTRNLGLSEKTVHCRDKGPEECAEKAAEHIKAVYGNVKIALVGYQPSLLERLSRDFPLRVLDLNPDNIGAVRYGIRVEDGASDMKNVTDWADLVLCTGSTICNGTICDFLNMDKEVLFFGTTLAGAAGILNCKRMCFCAE